MLLSRVFPFVRDYPVFYDSFEYVRLVQSITLDNALGLLRSSHQPVHTWYLLSGFVLHQLSGWSAPQVLALLSLLGGAAALFAWYRLVTRLLDDRDAARWSVLISAAAPYFFLGATNLVYEPYLIALQLWSLLALVRGLQTGSRNWIYFSGLLFGAAVATFIGSIFILPWFIGVVIWKFRRQGRQLLLFFAIAVALNLAIDWLVFQSAAPIWQKYLAHAGDTPRLDAGAVRFAGLLLRNSLLNLAAQLSVSGLAAASLGFVLLWRRDRNRAALILASLAPIFFLQQYWHAGMFGRLSLIGIFPVSLLLASAFRSRRVRLLLLALILATTVRILFSQLEPTPLARLRQLHLSTSADLAVTSDYSRFIFEGSARQVLVISGQTDRGQLTTTLSEAVSAGKTVVVDSLALRYPYYQYDGSFLHVLSAGKVGESSLKDWFKRWDFRLLSRDSIYPDIALYEIRPRLLPAESVNAVITESLGLTHPDSLFGSDWLVLLVRGVRSSSPTWYWEYRAY